MSQTLRRPATIAAALAILLLPATRLAAQPQDARFKADVLLVVAHPDDDTLAGTYLLKAMDQGKKVAVVYATSGQAGGSQVGPERGTSVGLIRQAEARRGLATLGITNVWFLTGADTAGQDPRRSLAVWGHGRVLDDLVRIVRLTRPEVILTWLPMPVEGENHGDHQASSVIAIEAFDLAGDPAAFPAQVATPVRQFESEYDGLQPWQPKKIYFMSDASDTSFLNGHGPSYPVTDVSKARGVPYWQLGYEQLQAHRTQYRQQLDQLAAATPAERERMFLGPGGLTNPLRLARGKSIVGGTPTGDVFEAVTEGPAAFAVQPRVTTDPSPWFALGGAWAYYREFWQAHGITELAGIAAQPLGPFDARQPIRIPLRIANAGSAPLTVALTSTIAAGWKGDVPASVTVPKGSSVEVAAIVSPADDKTADGAAQFTFTATTPGQAPISIAAAVVLRRAGGGLPQ